jgi:hypothetical protein
LKPFFVSCVSPPPKMSSSNTSTSNFVPMPLCRTPTLAHEPVANYTPEPVAVLLSDAEQNEKNEAMKSIFQKLRHTPAVLPGTPDLFRTDSVLPSSPAPLSRSETVRSYEPSGLRRTDYDGINYEGTTALAPSLMSGLSRAPSVMPMGLFRSPSIAPSSTVTPSVQEESISKD